MIFTSDRSFLSTEHQALLTGLPQDLTQLTVEQDLACVAFFVGLPLGELRDRQSICRAQQGDAYRQQNTRAAANLRVTEDQLARAVGEQTFGEPVPRGTHG